jgi:hypothetical protein
MIILKKIIQFLKNLLFGKKVEYEVYETENEESDYSKTEYHININDEYRKMIGSLPRDDHIINKY